MTNKDLCQVVIDLVNTAFYSSCHLSILVVYKRVVSISVIFSIICCVFVFLLFPHSRPLRICPWALVEWTKVDPHHSHLMVTTCPLTVWSLVALQPLTCRTRWMDRCLVSKPSPWNFPPSLFCPPFSSLSHLGCLATPQNWERSFDWKMMSPFCQLWWS